MQKITKENKYDENIGIILKDSKGKHSEIFIDNDSLFGVEYIAFVIDENKNEFLRITFKHSDSICLGFHKPFTTKICICMIFSAWEDTNSLLDGLDMMQIMKDRIETVRKGGIDNE